MQEKKFFKKSSDIRKKSIKFSFLEKEGFSQCNLVLVRGLGAMCFVASRSPPGWLAQYAQTLFT